MHVQIIALNLGGVKSFLERFGERCQERNQGSPLNGVGLARTPAATPSSPHKLSLLQERLAVTQGASSTALLTQKQKMVTYLNLISFVLCKVARVPVLSDKMVFFCS